MLLGDAHCWLMVTPSSFPHPLAPFMYNCLLLLIINDYDYDVTIYLLLKIKKTSSCYSMGLHV